MKILKNNVLLFLLFISSLNFAQKYAFNENFDSNSTWPTGNNEKRELKIYNGNYYFEHKKKESSWNVYSSKFDFDASKDFEITTSIKKIAGVQDYAFGLLFNKIDDKNFSQFAISANGYFRVAQTTNDEYQTLKSWTKSTAINTGNYGTNKLKIKKEGSTITFYINGSNVFSTSYTPFTGTRVGVIIYRDQKIAVDYLRVKYLSKNNIIPSTTVGKTLMYDSFYSNRNGWATGNASEYDIKIKNSNYYFEHKRKDKGWSSTLRKVIDQTRDFRIEANFLKINGIQNNGYGIIWGRKDGKNQNQFLINAIGSYSIDKYKNGKFIPIKDWTKESSLKKGNYATNTLSIEKRGNQLKFYINNTFIYAKDFEPFYGDRVGFVIFQNQKIAVDYISIKYLDNKKEVTYNDGEFAINEPFNNNNNEWLESDTEATRYVIKNGKYYFKHKKNTSGYSSYITKYFDDTKDFEIETKIDKVSGVTNYSYGILWGKRDKNSYRFYITGNGYYKIVRNKNGEEEVIVKWTKNSSIRTGNGNSNVLKIKKQGNIYKFYINGTYVNETDYEPFFGNKIGYVVFNNQEIAIDYLTVKYLKKSNNNTVTTKTLTLPLYDDFSSNKNGWLLDSSENYSASMSNGALTIDRKKKGGIFISRDINIDTSKDFIIETSIAVHRTEDTGLYGITFGRKNSSNEYSFLISNGDYMLRKFDNDKYTKLIPFTTSNAIKTTARAYNKIKIVKSGTILRFYINNQYVNETPFTGFFGNKFGYTVFYHQKISVNDLSIKYQSENFNNPPIVVITEPNVEAKRGFKIVKTKKVLVKGKATDKDGIYEVTINGIDATVYEDGRFVAKVPLKIGDNTLVVKATDIKQASSTKSFQIKRKSPDVVNDDDVVIVDPNKNDNLDIGFGNYYALLIGISDYGDSAIPDLAGMPKKDASDLANVLINKYNFKRENVILLNNSPKANDIIKEFIKLKKKVTNKDNLLVFYAGHGIYDKKNEIGHWLPADADMEYELNLISNTQVVDYLKSIKSKHTLLISDACFSGSIFKHRSFKKSPKSIQKKYELTSKKAITSGTLKTVPNKSVFLKYLLKRLNNNPNKYLPARKLFDQIEEPVMNNSPNTPQYGTIYGIGDEGGDFIFIKKE